MKKLISPDLDYIEIIISHQNNASDHNENLTFLSFYSRSKRKFFDTYKLKGSQLCFLSKNRSFPCQESIFWGLHYFPFYFFFRGAKIIKMYFSEGTNQTAANYEWIVVKIKNFPVRVSPVSKTNLTTPYFSKYDGS